MEPGSLWHIQPVWSAPWILLVTPMGLCPWHTIWFLQVSRGAHALLSEWPRFHSWLLYTKNDENLTLYIIQWVMHNVMKQITLKYLYSIKHYDQISKGKPLPYVTKWFSFIQKWPRKLIVLGANVIGSLIAGNQRVSVHFHLSELILELLFSVQF